MTPSRRTFLVGLGAALAAPSAIRTPGLLMPVRVPTVATIPMGYEGYFAANLQRIADGIGISYAELTQDWRKVSRQIEHEVAERRRLGLALELLS